jgi:hypothetical protein
MRPSGRSAIIGGMYANVASFILILIGSLFAVLGIFLGGNLFVAVIGLLAILAGGKLSIAARASA